MIKKRWIYMETGIHILLWGMYIWLMEFGLGTFWDQFELYHIRMMVYVPLVVFYLNAFLFIPNYLRKGRWFAYVLLGIATFIFIEMVRAGLAASFNEGSFLNYFSLDPFHSRALVSNATLGFVLSTGYKFTKDWIINVAIIDRLKAENLSRELAFLKAQVDPHFLFNTLNSLYALALKEDSEKTADGIIKLSTMMRYNLHDSQASKIPIKKEVDYIEKYISLQRLRASKKNVINFQVKGSAQQAEIAPMLLIPFVENAFKYGLSPIEDVHITVIIELTSDHLSLIVKNSIASGISVEESGVGIQNVKSRLNLLYPDSYTLQANEYGGEFHVALQLNLKK